jgi:hypothetical protein
MFLWNPRESNYENEDFGGVTTSQNHSPAKAVPQQERSEPYSSEGRAEAKP